MTLTTRSGYRWEFALLALAVFASLLGFWDIYFGDQADPQLRHHLHFLTAFGWLGFLVWQLRLIANSDFRSHRSSGLAILAIAPVMLATLVYLTGHSAASGIASGEGDFLIVQNVMATLEIAALVFAAFWLRKRRQVHGALLLSTAITFGGIASFFALISFAPPFRIEGPETFYRFQNAAITAQALWLGVGALLFARRPKSGWPYLLAGGLPWLNEAIRSLLEAARLLDPLTAVVAGADSIAAFVIALAISFAMLFLLVRPTDKPVRRAHA